MAQTPELGGHMENEGADTNTTCFHLKSWPVCSAITKPTNHSRVSYVYRDDIYL